MRTLVPVIITIVFFPLSGCSLGSSGIMHGTSISKVYDEYGPPDLIGDRVAVGEKVLTRYYLPTDEFVEALPGDSRRIYFYIDRDIQIHFKRGKAVYVMPIEFDFPHDVYERLKRFKEEHNSEPPPIIA